MLETRGSILNRKPSRILAVVDDHDAEVKIKHVNVGKVETTRLCMRSNDCRTVHPGLQHVASTHGHNTTFGNDSHRYQPEPAKRWGWCGRTGTKAVESKTLRQHAQVSGTFFAPATQGAPWSTDCQVAVPWG